MATIIVHFSQDIYNRPTQEINSTLGDSCQIYIAKPMKSDVFFLFGSMIYKDVGNSTDYAGIWW